MSITVNGSLGASGQWTFFGSAVYLNCTCPAGYYVSKIVFDNIGAGAYWKNGSASAKRLDIHLCDSSGNLLVANIFNLNLTGNGTNATTKESATFTASIGGQGIYILGGNATANVYLVNYTGVTVYCEPLSYTLYLGSETGGSLTSSPAAGSVYCGSTVTLYPSISTGYSFISYVSAPPVTITNNQFTMPASNVSIVMGVSHNSYTLSKASSPAAGGTVTLGATSGYYGSVINISASAATGYAFSKWTTTGGTLANANSASTTITMPNGNATVTASFTHVSRTLSGAVSPSGGGTVTLGASSGYYGDTISISASAATGYSFNKWTTSGGTLGNANSASTTITLPNANTTVTANFTHIERTLSSAVSPSGGGTVTLGATKGYYNSQISISATAATGYSFNKWTTTGGTLANANSASTTITMPNANATVTANFTHIERTLSSAVSPSGGGSVTLGATKGYYASVINISATASTGYSFNKWTTSGGTLGNANSASTTITMPNANATVTANFTHVEYTLSSAVSPSGGGSVTLNKSKGYYQDAISISATAATGYAFNNWTTTGGTLANANSASTTITMPAANTTVTANFTHIERTLSSAVSPSGGGTVTLAANKGYYQSVISISATAATGYAFSNWTTTGGTIANANAASTSITMPNANATVTANFTHVSYILSSSVSPSDSGTVTLGASSAYYTDTVSINATPAAGWKFKNWSTTGGTIANTSSASTTITMPAANTTVTAAFEKIDYNILTGISPANSGTLAADMNIAQVGDTVTLTATPARGYEFIGYTTDPEVIITNDTFTMPPSNISVVANFIPLFSIATLDDDTYEGGETAVLTITERMQGVTHRYKLRFGEDMDTGWVNVPVGDTTVNIYIPIEWGLHTVGNISVSGGELILETLLDNIATGADTITGLTYTVLDNTIPKFVVWRCDTIGNLQTDGEYARYSITLPSSTDSYSITYDGTTVQNPALTGDVLPNDKQEMSINNNHIITFSITVDGETFTTTRDIPKISKLNKALINRRL